ncbi:MAG: hypothetical protein V3V62_04075 [bacterium]
MRKGAIIFSRHLPNHADFPAHWRGPTPDFLIQKGDRLTAYLVESVESLQSEMR